jgi:hypothetical protein
MALSDFAKSFADFSWALSVYGFSQAGNVLRGLPTSAPTQKATDSFEATTAAIEKQFDVIDNAIYRPVKGVQDALIDVTFNFFSLNTFNPSTILQTSTNLLRWGVGVATQFIPGGRIGTGGPPVGWGPVNITDAELFYVPGGPSDSDDDSGS